MANNKWYGRELQYLRENYNVITFDKIAEKLNRHTVFSIRNKARALGICRKHIDNREYYSSRYKNMTISEQARAMGMSYGAVYRELVTKKDPNYLAK